jgi:hypothetical protein
VVWPAAAGDVSLTVISNSELRDRFAIPIPDDKLAEVISTTTGIRASGYLGDKTIAPPCLRVAREEMDPRFVFGAGGTAEYPFLVIVYAGRAADKASEKLLDTYCEMTGASSVRAAVETLSNWSGVTINYATVTRVGTTSVVEVGGVPYLVVEFDVVVCF